MDLNIYWPKEDRERVTEIDLYFALKKRIGTERAQALIRYINLMMTQDDPPEEKLREYRQVLDESFKKRARHAHRVHAGSQK